MLAEIRNVGFALVQSMWFIVNFVNRIRKQDKLIYIFVH